jgi:N utilization substance protein A
VKSEFMIAITQLAAEKNLPREVILEAMEAALVSAYKKDSDLEGNIVVHIDRETGDHRVYREERVVAQVEDPKAEISLQDAKKTKPDATIDDVISTEVHPSHAGRIAAQTAKQVVLQRLREAEREMVRRSIRHRSAHRRQTHCGRPWQDGSHPAARGAGADGTLPGRPAAEVLPAGGAPIP